MSNAFSEVLQYQGHESLDNPEKLPMAFTATQLPMLSEQDTKQYKQVKVRNMISANRVTDRMVQEVFN